MKISSKGRYAVRIIVELASTEKEYVSISELATRQNLSPKYLERIVSLLMDAKLLESSLGSLGGYKLSKQPHEYNVAEILQVTGDLPKLAPCLCSDKTCENQSVCKTITCWDKLSKIIYDYLKGVTIQDLIDTNL